MENSYHSGFDDLLMAATEVDTFLWSVGAETLLPLLHKSQALSGHTSDLREMLQAMLQTFSQLSAITNQVTSLS